MARRKPKKKSNFPRDYDDLVKGIVQIAVFTIETIGWPGALVGFIMWFIVKYASPEQKERIIELYVLGTGILSIWPIILVSSLAILLVLAQHAWYKRSMKRFTAEMDRIGKEKSDLQEQLTGKALRHAESDNKKGR